MQIVVNIPNECKEFADNIGKVAIEENDFDNFVTCMMSAVRVGIVFPETATNGDVIQVLFPDARFDNAAPFSDERWETFRFKGISHSNEVYKPTVLRTYRDWWNAPYKES